MLAGFYIKLRLPVAVGLLLFGDDDGGDISLLPLA